MKKKQVQNKSAGEDESKRWGCIFWILCEPTNFLCIIVTMPWEYEINLAKMSRILNVN